MRMRDRNNGKTRNRYTLRNPLGFLPIPGIESLGLDHVVDERANGSGAI
jgi:hypothetical protein